MPGDLSNPGIEPPVTCIGRRIFATEPPGKPDWTQAGAVQDGRPFVCAGRWALLRKQGWLPPDTYPNLCDWIPGSPGGSPLKACLYLPFFFLHIPPSPMKCESSGAWTSWTTHPCFPLLIPAIRELWSFPSLCISTLLPTLRPGQPGWPTLCSSLGKVSAPLWGGSPSHWSPPVRPSDWHWPQSLRLHHMPNAPDSPVRP